jgi:uncharacterized protein DUF5069
MSQPFLYDHPLSPIEHLQVTIVSIVLNSRMSTMIPEQLPRSPYDTVGGLVFLPRMFHKIRLHAEGFLPKAYHQNLGREFDGHCLSFLHLGYSDLKDRVLAGGTDEEILEWCFANGRRPHEGEFEIFNGFMQKAGWRDRTSTRLAKLLQESNLAEREPKCLTRFDFIELDEGRSLPDSRYLD